MADDQALVGELVHRLAYCVARGPEARGERALGRQSRARTQASFDDRVPQALVDNLAVGVGFEPRAGFIRVFGQLVDHVWPDLCPPMLIYGYIIWTNCSNARPNAVAGEG